PISAIRVDQSGAAYVEKAGAHDQLSRVAVKPGVVGDTLVQVTPAAGASLAAGDRVVVSR
ncbi:MAG: hypothetical protein LBM66_04905, partial [Bifidobacteriaceae bacterium]|nr:hypothetical protein [Bifidobacteriaceae bacterium]